MFWLILMVIIVIAIIPWRVSVGLFSLIYLFLNVCFVIEYICDGDTAIFKPASRWLVIYYIITGITKLNKLIDKE